jgi:hypothetical protein
MPLEAEFAARYDDCRAADFDAVDLVRRPVDTHVQRRRPAYLGPLRHLDLLAELGAAVTCQMDAERSARGAGRRILGDTARRCKHPRLPARPRTREAVDAYGRETTERTEIGLERSHLSLAAELEEDMVRPQVVDLDRQLRAHPEQLLQLLRLREQLPVRDRLLHAAEDDASSFALECYRDDAGAGLEVDLSELQGRSEDERGSEHGMSGKWQLGRGREDPDPRVATGLGRQDEHGLGDVHLTRELLHGLVVNAAPMGEDGELITGERDVCEDVRDDVAKGGRHRPILYDDRVARRLLLLVAAVAALSGSAPAIAVVSGEHSLLVIRATWGPKPFATEDVKAVLDKVDAFFRTSSFGRVSFTSTVTPWVRAYDSAPACNPLNIAYPADDAAKAAGYDPSGYDRIIYLFPKNECAWAGSRYGKRALLNGTLTVANTAHELGHTFGLPHAQAWSCDPRPCGVVNYGDPYDTMGSGIGDFDSYEKWLLGWITRVTHASKPALYTLAPIEAPSAQAQGLIVTTTRNRYWFEVRRDPARDATGALLMQGGLLVHAGPSPTIAPGLSSYGGLSNALILDPVGRGRPWLQAGDRFGEPGAFRIEVLQKTGSSHRLRFAWTDKTPPKRPSIVFPGTHVRRWTDTQVTWRDSNERGSGIAEYRMSIDGAPAVSVTQSIYPELNAARIADLPRGTHTISIVAVDRAGNRSRPAIRRFVVGSS